MIRFFVLAAALSAGSTLAAYEDHQVCIEAQVSLYELHASLSRASEEFGISYRKQEKGLEQAREADAAFKSVKASIIALTEAHRDYCSTLPSPRN